VAAPIPIIVLASKISSRTDVFLKAWEGTPEISITVMPGVYFDQSEAPVDPLKTFQNITGRSMTIQELGCARAHYLAREVVADSEVGGVIFEDDARFNEPNRILRIALDFLGKHRGQSAVLNLCASSLSPFHVNQSIDVVKLLGHSPLAVAYVLTPEAARELNRANSPITWVSDWPYSKVAHSICVPALVAHGDEHSGSEIAILLNGKDLRHGRNSIKKMSTLLNPRRISNSIRNRNFLKFFYFVFVAPVLWRLDHIKLSTENRQK
jgi:hypothetical protein